MLKTVDVVETYDEVIKITEKTTGEYLSNIENFIASFETENIQLVAKPCYFFNGKFETKSKQKGACVFIRIQLHPNNIAPTQAKKEHYMKEFFSRKLVEFSKTTTGYSVKTYALQDKAMIRFLKKHLQKAREFKKKDIQTIYAVRESPEDVFRSLLYMGRYRSEIKTSYRGFDLIWIILALLIVLTLLRAYVHQVTIVRR